MRVSFENTRAALLFVPVVLLFLTWIWVSAKKRDVLARFLSNLMQHRLLLRLSRPRLRLAMVGIAPALLVVALMRPQGPGSLETVSTGTVAADVVVVLDVSKSMLAEDAAPSRLGRAKAEIRDLLSRMKGHRLSLVAFAGRAQVLCPLTPDYGFFRMVLESAGPRSISRGGTRIGDGLRAAQKTFGPGSGPRLVLLITDGEDHESYPMDAAKALAKEGIRVISIGFGDERGSEIAITDPQTGAKRFVTDRNGQVVRSKLDGKTLREIALTTGGAYIPAGVSALDLESIVKEHVQPLIRQAGSAASADQVRSVPREFYPHVLLLALLALLSYAFLSRVEGESSKALLSSEGLDA